MNEHRDIILSLRRQIALALRAYDSDYDVRMAIEEDAFKRPTAIVQTAGPAQLSNQHFRIARTIRPFSIYVYPPEGENPKLAELEAGRVEAVLSALVQRGGQGARPARIPIYFWGELDDGDPLPDDAEPVAWMKIEDATVDHKPDPDDERLVTVYANIRGSWRGLGEAYEATETLESITVKPAEGGVK